jgi:CMP/dCMP kinase
MKKRAMRIAVSGKSGCGNSTVSRLLSKKLGITFINYTFHTMADELGVSMNEIMERAGEDPRFDYGVDKRQIELARKGSCVLGSRLAIWLLGEAKLKVYLDASLFVRAQRIQRREGGSLEEVLDSTRARDDQDHDRYMSLYGIDNDDFRFADLIIDTTSYTPEEIADLIVESLPEDEP